MDIEGAEGPIFDNNPEIWLDRVGFIIVETHGTEITESVLGKLDSCGWSYNRYRNLYFCRRA